MIVFSRILDFVILGEIYAKSCIVKMQSKRYKKFREEGDIEALTLMIDPKIEIILHSTDGYIDYKLLMERKGKERIILAVLSYAYTVYTRCLYENDRIIIVHQITKRSQ